MVVAWADAVQFRASQARISQLARPPHVQMGHTLYGISCPRDVDVFTDTPEGTVRIARLAAGTPFEPDALMHTVGVVFDLLPGLEPRVAANALVGCT